MIEKVEDGQQQLANWITDELTNEPGGNIIVAGVGVDDADERAAAVSAARQSAGPNDVLIVVEYRS